MPAEPDDDLLRAAYDHAWRKLGYMVTPMNRKQWGSEEREAWDEAVNEYLAAHREKENGTG